MYAPRSKHVHDHDHMITCMYIYPPFTPQESLDQAEIRVLKAAQEAAAAAEAKSAAAVTLARCADGPIDQVHVTRKKNRREIFKPENSQNLHFYLSSLSLH